MAATFDLLPTFANLAGATKPESKIDGRDIWPLLSGESTESPHDEFYYFRGGGKLQAVRSGKWKLRLASVTGKGNKQKKQAAKLFDLRADISEANDVAESNPDIVTRLSAKAVAFAAEIRQEARPEGKLK